MRDVRTATIAAFRHIVETDEALRGIERRQALKDWVDLLAASHPLDMCAHAAGFSHACLPVKQAVPGAARRSWRSCTLGSICIKLAAAP